MSRSTHRSLAAAAALVVAAAASLVGAAAPAHAGVVGTYDFTTAGGHGFDVPAGVDTAVVDLYGAQGGTFSSSFVTSPGGLGGHVHTTISLTQGQWLAIVGGAGASTTPVQGNASGCTAAGGAGGFGGGGTGGTAHDVESFGFCFPGAGGGGPTSVQPVLGSYPTAVAAGGGGAALESAGGAGGGTTGAAGAGDDFPAKGGSLSGPGAGGQFAACVDAVCVPGSSGGANGGGGGDLSGVGGGGGGGGWFGGGGGAAGSGAGGSSSPDGSAPGDVNESGVRQGDGEAVIVYGSADEPTITQDSPPHAVAGRPYSYRFAATGWPGPVMWSVFPQFGLGLPDGLTLAPDGTLSGTATQAGVYPVELRARNFTASSFDQLTIVVDPGAPAALHPSGAQTTLAGTRFPSAVSATLVDAYGNPIPGSAVHFSLPASAPSATFDATGTTSVDASTDANGVATAGTVTAGPSGGTYAVTASAPGVPDATIALAADQAAAFAAGAPRGAKVGHAYGYRVATTGYPAATVTLVGGALPPGIALAPDGTLSGTPTTAGRYHFTLQAANGIGSPVTRVMKLRVR